MAALASLASGFGDPSHESQAVFRAVMNALARPTTIQALLTGLEPPAPLKPELAAIALALADNEAPIWLDPPLRREAAVSAYLRFHTGAAIVDDPAEAAFALIAEPAALLPFERFAIGTEEYPDRSTTLVLAVETLKGSAGFAVEGPGIKGTGRLAPAPLPADFADSMRGNRGLFPRGIDLIFAARGEICALPRSSRLFEEA